MGHGKRSRPWGLLAEHSSQDNGCLGIPRMKEVRRLPKSTHFHPHQVVPVPTWEEGALALGAGWRGTVHPSLQPPHLPLLLPTLIHNRAPESCPGIPSLWILGESCSLCFLSCKIRGLESVVAKFPTDLKCPNAVVKRYTSFGARLPEFKSRSAIYPVIFNTPTSAFLSVKWIEDRCPSFKGLS